MPRNVEIKARVVHPAQLRERVASLADSGPLAIGQDDTFFACDNGRLKLRVFADGSGELIYYRRADHSGPRESFYIRSATSEPDSLRESLQLAYGQVGRVRKQRELFHIGRTRIHLDVVQDLGEFIELEAVLVADEPHEQAERELFALMEQLGVREDQLIEGAYVDLQAIKQRRGG